TIDKVKYEKGKSYIIPVAQPNSALVGIIFDDKKDYNDVHKLGYGAGFSVAYSSGLAYAPIANPAKGARLETKLKNQVAPFSKSDYAYLIDFRDSRSQAALFRLLEKNIIVKTASQSFSINNAGQTVDFPVGTLLIPVANQPLSSGELFVLLQSVSTTEEINVLPVTTGYNVKGVDLGSSAFRRIHKPKALILTGGSVSSTEAGEVWHLFDQKLAYPIVRVETESFNRIPLYDYNRIILAGGAYTELSTPSIEKLKQWISNGGVLITLNSASQWASRNLLETRAARRTDSVPPIIAAPTGRRGLPTSVIETRINLNSPLAYGLTRESLPVTKENLSVLKGNPVNTVASYPDNLLLNGYLNKEAEAVFKNSASILTGDNIILFAEDPVFRGVWDAAERTFVNAVLFGDLIRPVFW
ncbi:MAG: hypothetical protein LBC48_03810, partial [Dysgonamonadaceae bacterium]|nr:hypothetical protein [Dysgonamonadaceae bacterium]